MSFASNHEERQVFQVGGKRNSDSKIEGGTYVTTHAEISSINRCGRASRQSGEGQEGLSLGLKERGGASSPIKANRPIVPLTFFRYRIDLDDTHSYIMIIIGNYIVRMKEKK